MNKKQAMLEKLKGKEVIKCNCGDYSVETESGKSWIAFRCDNCDFDMMRSRSLRHKDIFYPRFGSKTYEKQNKEFKNDE